jgi:hypothetical protein
MYIYIYLTSVSQPGKKRKLLAKFFFVWAFVSRFVPSFIPSLRVSSFIKSRASVFPGKNLQAVTIVVVQVLFLVFFRLVLVAVRQTDRGIDIYTDRQCERGRSLPKLCVSNLAGPCEADLVEVSSRLPRSLEKSSLSFCVFFLSDVFPFLFPPLIEGRVSIFCLLSAHVFVSGRIRNALRQRLGTSEVL